MNAQLENVYDSKREEVIYGSTVLCQKMESHVNELASMVQLMRDMLAKANNGEITAEEGVRRYLVGLHGLIEVAGKNDLVDGMLLQMKRRAEQDAIRKLADEM
jgi:hypothetical protein